MANEGLIHIDVKEFTDNVTTNNSFEVAGTGIFDALMGTATKHLTAQLEAGRLRGEDYATAYIQVYTVTLQAALQAWLQKPLNDKQKELLETQIETEKAKRSLHIRQIEAFDEDYKQKILKILLDAWSVCFSVAKDAFEAEGMPAPISKVAIDSVFNEYVIKDLDDYIYGRDTAKK